MQVDLVVFALLLVFGCAAFFFGIIYAVIRLIGAIGRGFAEVLWPSRRPVATPRRGGVRKAWICVRRRCRKVEYRSALYCSQCGAPLGEAVHAEDGT